MTDIPGSDEFIETIAGFRPTVLQQTRVLSEFEHLEAEGNFLRRLIELGARFTQIVESKNGGAYRVYGFKGIALVIAQKGTGESCKIFAIEYVSQIDTRKGTDVYTGIGRSITKPEYVRKVREEMGKLARGETAEFPNVPLKYLVTELELRRANARALDWKGFPGRIVTAVMKKVARRYA